MALIETIESVVDRMKKNSYRNETDIREAVVTRLLHELGWDIYDTLIVQREFTVEKRRVDYALFTNSTSPSIFIEVKGPNAGDDGDRQLFEYAFHQGTPFAILVNGREWSFYLPAEQGSYSERRVQKLDLVERNSKDAADVLVRYLKFDRVRDGTAYADARSDYQNKARAREAEKAIPLAWKELVAKPDELLIELVAEKVVSLIGFRPTDEQIEDFFVHPPVAGKFQPTISLAEPQAQQQPHERLKQTTAKGVTITFLGQTFHRPDAVSAFIFLIQELAKRDPAFLESFATRAPGRTRNHISKVRSQVYPGKPELEASTVEVSSGWWMGTNLANREKDRLTKIACDVAHLKFGVDVVVEFPNAHS